MREEEGRSPTGAAAALPGEALGDRPGPASVLMKVLSAFLSGGLLVLLFLVIVPALGSLAGVWNSISSMSVATFVVLLFAALVIRVLLAAVYPPLIPGLSFVRSLIARESSSAVSNVVPGPSGTATQYVVLRSWGVSTERFAGAKVSVSVITGALVFAAPGLLFLLWVVLGRPAEAGSEHVRLIGIVTLAVSVITVVLVSAVARSERLAALLGRIGQRCVNPARRALGKEPVTTWPQRARDLRTVTLSQVHGNARVLGACLGGGYLLNGFLLVTCLWACGVEEAVMPVSLGLFLYSIGRALTIVPITPGSIGVAEVVYTAVYVAVLGEESQNTVLAGVLVYRALTWGLPLVTGAFSYVAWRVMRHREIHALAWSRSS
jgi:putative heme transporter